MENQANQPSSFYAIFTLRDVFVLPINRVKRGWPVPSFIIFEKLGANVFEFLRNSKGKDNFTKRKEHFSDRKCNFLRKRIFFYRNRHFFLRKMDIFRKQSAITKKEKAILKKHLCIIACAM